MDFSTADEHLALRQAVAAITAQFGNDYYTRKAEAREFTSELWQALGKHGYLGINIPEAYGGGGAGLVELAIVCEETAAQGCPLLLLLVSSAICGEVISAYGTAQQRARWLPRLAAGDGKIVFAITEPDAGSNTHRLSTTAVRDGEDYLLCGRSTTSPASTRPTPSSSSPGPAPTSAPATRPCPCSSSTPTPPG